MKNFIIVGIIIFLSSFLSHKVTITYYENIDNKVLTYLNDELIRKINEIDNLKDDIKNIEDIVGVEYENQEEDIDIQNRIEKVKLKINTIVNRTNMKESIPSGKPLQDIKITSDYGIRYHPVLKKKKYHSGVDLRANENTKVYATASGVVRFLGNQKNGYGKYLIIQHNYGFETIYAHLNKFKVKNGDIIKKGDVIALTGNTGRSTGPHLHYETRFGGQSIAPIIKN